MKETSQQNVDKMISKIYRDALIKKSNKQFITLQYTKENFPDNMHEVLKSVLSFLPNTKHKGQPFIMSVSVNKKTEEYEIIVKNPIL
jgi:ribonuclease BN (tRNA processing enzyme)